MRKYIVVALCLLGLCLSKLSFAEIGVGENYYTACNIWYENPDRLSSLNYHSGTMLPLGTKIEVVYAKEGKIVFVDKDEKQYTMNHELKYSTINLEELFNRYFTKSKPNTLFLSSKAKKAIKEGQLVRKIKRNEVLMAYGYPPSHATKDLSADKWIYWVNRSKKETVHFTEDTLTYIER